MPIVTSKSFRGKMGALFWFAFMGIGLFIGLMPVNGELNDAIASTESINEVEINQASGVGTLFHDSVFSSCIVRGQSTYSPQNEISRHNRKITLLLSVKRFFSHRPQTGPPSLSALFGCDDALTEGLRKEAPVAWKNSLCKDRC